MHYDYSSYKVRGKFKSSKMKDLSVSLRRDPLVELKCKNLLQSTDSQRRPRLQQMNNDYQCKKLTLQSKEWKQSQHQTPLNEKNKIKQFKNDFNKEKVVSKRDNTCALESMVVLGSFDRSKLRQKDNNNETKKKNENVALKSDIYAQAKVVLTKYVTSQKLPVYKQTSKNNFRRDNNLYEQVTSKRHNTRKLESLTIIKDNNNKIKKKNRNVALKSNIDSQDEIVSPKQVPFQKLPVCKQTNENNFQRSSDLYEQLVNKRNNTCKLQHNPVLESFDRNKLRHRDKNGKTKRKNENTVLNNDIHSHDEIVSIKHIPSHKLLVYEQTKKDNFQRTSDMYEFNEPDSINIDGKKAKRKIRKQKVKGIESKPQINKGNRNKGKTVKSKTRNNYEAIIQEIIKNVAQKIHPPKFENKTSTPIRKQQVQSRFNVNNEVVDLHLDDNLSHIDEADNLHLDHDADQVDDVDNLHLDCDVSSHIDDDDVSNLYVDHDLPHTDIETSGKEKIDENRNRSSCENEVDSNPNNCDHFVGITSPTRTKQNKKIHVIQDITFKEDDGFSFFDTQFPPSAYDNIFARKNCTPWRYTENLVRNPHYLIIKSTSSLPCLKQDMVIDYKLLKKLKTYLPKSPKKVKNKKPTPPSKTARDVQDVNKENITHSNLFDDFSDHVKILQENSPKKQKRTVLGLLQQNFINKNAASPNYSANNAVNVEQSQKTSTVQTSENTEIQELDQNLDKSALPSEKLESDLAPKLFEDEEQSFNFTKSIKIYKPTKRKRKRLMSQNVEEIGRNKARKDIMTKTEEAEMEQWAAKFNSMCEDVEKYDLEVE